MQAAIENWLASFADTALRGDLDGHMAHISPAVQVFGVEGFDTLGFEDWRQQCAHEFPQQVIQELRYQNPRLRSQSATQVLFVIDEQMLTRDGQRLTQPLEMLLQKQQDTWLLRQLRLLSADEAQHYRQP